MRGTASNRLHLGCCKGVAERMVDSMRAPLRITDERWGIESLCIVVSGGFLSLMLCALIVSRSEQRVLCRLPVTWLA